MVTWAAVFLLPVFVQSVQGRSAPTGRLPPERIPDASTLFNVVNRVAGSFGIGLLASL